MNTLHGKDCGNLGDPFMQQRNWASNDVSLGFASGETWDYKPMTYRLCAANVSKKKRQELNSSLRCPHQQEMPYLRGGPILVRRWRAERSVLLFSMLGGGGRTYACDSRVLVPRQKDYNFRTSRSFFNARE